MCSSGTPDTHEMSICKKLCKVLKILKQIYELCLCTLKQIYELCLCTFNLGRDFFAILGRGLGPGRPRAFQIGKISVVFVCLICRGQKYLNIALVLQDETLTIFTRPAKTCTCPLKAYMQ